MRKLFFRKSAQGTGPFPDEHRSDADWSAKLVPSSAPCRQQHDIGNQDDRASESSSDSSPNDTAKVKFSDVTIHYHDFALGDHPQVSSGPPLAFGEWTSTEEFSLSEYERTMSTRHQQHGQPWNERAQINSKERMRMLTEAGVPMQRIQNRIHYQRIQKDAHRRSSLIAARNERRTGAFNL
mmetsp:Transcript_15219/g.42103  ORF Transcript_15219/g.42103 Transcript_15219/m.42103 type:complete len:181 (+) Transcript_15219:3314-3856(+)